LQGTGNLLVLRGDLVLHRAPDLQRVQSLAASVEGCQPAAKAQLVPGRWGTGAVVAVSLAAGFRGAGTMERCAVRAYLSGTWRADRRDAGGARAEGRGRRDPAAPVFARTGPPAQGG